MATVTADLYDEHGDDLQSCTLQFLQYGGVSAFEGSIVTVQCFEDTALLRSVLEGPGDGRVLVVDGGGSLATALVGDIVTAVASDNGWAGLVLNGAVRDVSVLSTVPIGIKALGSNPRKNAKTGAGTRDVPVMFGGVTFAPRAVLYCDADGILVTRV